MSASPLWARWASALLFVGALFAGSAIAAPALFYSDLDSAPQDAFVTVYGKGFGNTAGAIEVGSGITVPGDIITWSDTRVEFQLPALATDSIRLITAGNEPSNVLPFTTRSNGRIFFVSTSGSDSNDGLAPTNGSGNRGPWRNLPRLLDSVQPGDVVYVRGGDYTKVHDSTWKTNLLVREKYSGTAGNPIALTAYPGEQPVVGGTTSRAIYLHYSLSHWTVAKMTLKASDTAIGFTQNGAPQGIRIVGNTAGGINSQYGTVRFNACTDCRVLGNHVYNSGQSGNKLAHLIYYGGFGAGANVEIAWNRLHDERGGRAIQVYGHTDSDSLRGLSIHDNVIWNIPYDAILVGSSDASKKDWIEDAEVYNNVIWNANHAGIRIHNPGVRARVAHNTVHGSGSGLRIQQAEHIEVLNNLFSDNGTAIDFESAGSAIVEHNGYTDAASSQDSAPHFGVPSYTDAAGGDFSLGTDSSFLHDGVPMNPAFPEVSIPASTHPHLGWAGWWVSGGGSSGGTTDSTGGGGSSGGGGSTDPEPTNQAPVADFTVSCDGLVCTFQGTASADADGQITGYQWNFGDGSVAQGELVSHTYAADGSYMVTLTVTDDGGLTGSAGQSTQVSAPVASDISLTLTRFWWRGNRDVLLMWDGAAGDQVRIVRRRNGSDDVTWATANDGGYNDYVERGGDYTYQVCTSDGAACSAPAEVQF